MTTEALKTLSLLEFEAIRSRVASCALSDEAARLIEAALPCTDARETADLKALVSPLRDRLNSGDPEPAGGLPEIGGLLPKLEAAGAALEPEEAYALGIFLERGEAFRRWLLPGWDAATAASSAEPARKGASTAASSGGLPENGLPKDPQRVLGSLGLLAQAVPDCSEAAREIFRVLDREGKLRDLPEFREIKRRIQSLTRDLETAALRYTGSEETRRMLQSGLPSQRDGRMVLALKANFRGRIRGIVHEVSATGQTLFVEPEDVVEKNNDILIEQRRLDAEIRRVFRELTGRIAEHRDALGDFHRKILHLECIRARARYSQEIRGHFSREAPEGALILVQARHPLLGSRAVPIDFALASKQDAASDDEAAETRTVIITGPNTGGKTVALKTVGLLALMNQFGLALPAAEGTVLPVFDGVYGDIGDEQSLSQSLSTFSAHMINIAAIAHAAGKDSLVLLDELGSGTDPEEGSAMAMAILDYLREKDCRIIATTHHGMLKNYGYTHRGVENASVDFDGQTLSPTYRIVMGIPGESRAVDIAERNGLPREIIRGARGYLAEERSDVSALITELKQKHQELDAARVKARSETALLREERRRADLRELRLRQKELSLKEGGAGSLRLLLRESRKTLENLVREVKEGELSREKTLRVKEFLGDLEATVKAQGEALDEEARLLGEERSRLEAEEAEAATEAATGGAPAGKIPLRPGIEVLAGEFRRRGTLRRPGKKGTWIVEIGSLRMTMAEGELSPLPPSREAPQSPLVQTELAENTRAQAELSLRGMRLEEALEALERQIDAAVLSGLQEFAVVHGKGDGILQRGVHEYLKHQNQVADYYFSRPELGGFGRTEVILKGG
jgi:DNA mismatch repair protein MutS2